MSVNSCCVRIEAEAFSVFYDQWLYEHKRETNFNNWFFATTGCWYLFDDDSFSGYVELESEEEAVEWKLRWL